LWGGGGGGGLDWILGGKGKGWVKKGEGGKTADADREKRCRIRCAR